MLPPEHRAVGNVMDPERRKDIIRTALIVALAVLLGLALLDMLIGDPAAIAPPPEL